MPMLATTLAAAKVLMNDCRHPWCIFGGTLAALRGLRDDEVADVDVLLHIDDARRLCAREGIVQSHDGGNGRFRSEIFVRLVGHPLPIEVMAGLAVSHGGEWRSVAFPEIETITWQGLTLPVPTLAGMVALHSALGRPKDLALVARVVAQLEPQPGVTR